MLYIVRIVKESESLSHSIMSDSLQPHRLQPTRLPCPWNSPGKNTEVGSCSLLQGIFPTQGSNLGLLHCMPILYHLSHQGSSIIFKDFQFITLHIYICVCHSYDSKFVINLYFLLTYLTIIYKTSRKIFVERCPSHCFLKQ